MQRFGIVRPNLNLSVHKVLDKVEDAGLDLFAIFGLAYILDKPTEEFLLCPRFIAKEQQAFPLCFREDLIGVDPHKDLYLFYVLQPGLKGEIA